ncbi:SNARE-interacting protein KEULE [Platanthera guangdongensis]|uniref:SNARE-interacting protein KEULE n=1 Tax=Platanthera guangdongensis TaxID=2320717 RepID=A0ABR2MQ01_9ASPA
MIFHKLLEISASYDAAFSRLTASIDRVYFEGPISPKQSLISPAPEDSPLLSAVLVSPPSSPVVDFPIALAKISSSHLSVDMPRKFVLECDLHSGLLTRPPSLISSALAKISVQELVEKLSKGDLPKNEYQCMNDPSPSFHESSNGAPVRNTGQPAHSMRSKRPATWARPRNSDDGYSSDSVLKYASNDFKNMGQRIFIFIIGGATRSELRVAHKLTSKLKREIILGSTSIDDPAQFITGAVAVCGGGGNLQSGCWMGT